MTDTVKTLLLTAGFMALAALAVVFKSVLLLCIVVAIISAVTTALLYDPYKIVSVEPREKSIEVLEISREESE